MHYLAHSANSQGRTHTAREHLHELLASGHLPPPINNQRCPECSLKNICLPSVIAEPEKTRKATRGLFAIEGGN